MLKQLVTSLVNILPSQVAYAHCDVPCGIYDPKPAQIAAATVAKMVEKIEALPNENPSVEDRNNFVRMVWTKEEHARKCKEELLILWTDYFKPEHLEKLPELHEKIWMTAKQVSKVKQSVDEEAAKKLVEMVQEIGEMFAKVEGAPKKE